MDAYTGTPRRRRPNPPDWNTTQERPYYNVTYHLDSSQEQRRQLEQAREPQPRTVIRRITAGRLLLWCYLSWLICSHLLLLISDGITNALEPEGSLNWMCEKSPLCFGIPAADANITMIVASHQHMKVLMASAAQFCDLATNGSQAAQVTNQVGLRVRQSTLSLRRRIYVDLDSLGKNFEWYSQYVFTWVSMSVANSWTRHLGLLYSHVAVVSDLIIAHQVSAHYTLGWINKIVKGTDWFSTVLVFFLAPSTSFEARHSELVVRRVFQQLNSQLSFEVAFLLNAIEEFRRVLYDSEGAIESIKHKADAEVEFSTQRAVSHALWAPCNLKNIDASHQNAFDSLNDVLKYHAKIKKVVEDAHAALSPIYTRFFEQGHLDAFCLPVWKAVPLTKLVDMVGDTILQTSAARDDMKAKAVEGRHKRLTAAELGPV